jgi:hypothetical protein
MEFIFVWTLTVPLFAIFIIFFHTKGTLINPYILTVILKLFLEH